MIFDEISDAIKSSNNIAIFTHQNSDCDALGSSIALKLVLEKMNKNVAIFVQKPIRKNCFCLDIEKHINNSTISEFDLAVSLDCPNKKRFGIYEKKFDVISKSIAIDHHSDFEKFAYINCVDADCSSTCLLLFRIFERLGIELDSEIAKCLYAGIATDTGRFNYGNLDSEVFETVAKLYKYNFDYLEVNYQLFQKQTFNQVELFKIGIDKCKFFENQQIAIVRLDCSDFAKTNTDPNDTYKILEFIQNIETIKIACILTQDKGQNYMVSIRTRDLSANNIARFFGGGGHNRASGCRIFTDGNTAFNKLLDACRSELNKNLGGK